MITLRVASRSRVELGACRQATMLGWPQLAFTIDSAPVELQDQPGAQVFAQPFEGETLLYARLRMQEMHRQFGAPPAHTIDVAIESGAYQHGARYVDQAVVLLYTPSGGEQLAVWSQPVPFPGDSAERALSLRAQNPQITAGHLIHAKYPQIPADDWQEHFPPRLSRHRQISSALQEALMGVL